MKSLWPGDWTKELVLHNVKADHEVDLVRSHGVELISLSRIVEDLRKPSSVVSSSAGGDFIELITLGTTAA